jgi:hypothetical protein
MQVAKSVWRKWQSFGRAVGNAVGRVVMTLLYFTIVLPFGLGVRFFGDPLRLKKHKPHWLDRQSHDQTLEDARRLY